MIILIVLAITGLTSCNSTKLTINSGDLVIKMNNKMEVKANSIKGAKPLTNDFNASEYLITRTFEARQFDFKNSTSEPLEDAHGKGTVNSISGTFTQGNCRIDKRLAITTYDNFPGMAFFRVFYINSGSTIMQVKGWVNHSYNVAAAGDKPSFWSFQGGSSSRRADWILPVDSTFYQTNYQGMENVDYGGGIPVTDLWRKDAGIAIGHVEPAPKLVDLPVKKDQYSDVAGISVEYTYLKEKSFKPGDTLVTFETFVAVHTGDCYSTLKNYSEFIQSGGIKFVPEEPEAFEPVWCAWGYGQKFTIQDIEGTLQKVKDVGIKWVDIDDGYQVEEGDWHIPSTRFPNGEADMRKLVDKIHKMGLKAKIWWAPLAVSPDTKLFKENSDIIIRNKDNAPQYITGWEDYYMSPGYYKTIEHTKDVIRMYLKDWDYDGLKIDGMHINMVGPDYNRRHKLTEPEKAPEQVPEYFQMVYETAKEIKPNAVIQNCPCGCVISIYNLPTFNQAVASDPTSSWQIRLKAKVYKALRPGIAYYGDHIELSDKGFDFPAQFGVGAVLGTKFTYPEKRFKLTPEKEEIMRKWISMYYRELISKGDYLGSLYDIGYDKPETHVIEKGDTIYYSFYGKEWDAAIDLRGLKGKGYRLLDYENGKDLGTVNGSKPQFTANFKNHLLVKAIPLDH